MPEIAWPTSTAPGVHPTESGGRLINCLIEQAAPGSRSKYVWRRPAGLTELITLVETDARGAAYVGGVLYVVSADRVFSITASGGSYFASQLTGTVGGSGKVMMARNMATVPNILIQHSDGLSLINITGGSVADFSDASLPATNSICWIDGYFIATAANGDAYQSGINNTSFSSIDRQRAEASPDGLVRAIANGRDLLLMGETSIEFYANVGNETGFAFNRGPVLPLGLAGPYAVAGFEEGFTSTLVMVANDRTVHRIDGYSSTKISTSDLDRLLEAVSDPDDIECSVYVASGHPIVMVSTPDWSWGYDLSNGGWHERRSYQSPRWCARFGVYAFGMWVTFDRASGKVFKIDATKRTEDGAPLVWTLQSAQQHKFPRGLRIPHAAFDFVTGVGMAAGIDPIQTDPSVRISWSDDGGVTFGNPLTRRLGGEGQDVNIDIYNCGLTNRRGRCWKLEVSDPVDVAFLGGAMDIEDR